MDYTNIFQSEFKVVRVNEQPPLHNQPSGDSPETCIQYWNSYVRAASWFNSDVECAVGLALNNRCKIIGHFLISVGTINGCFMMPREVFRAAILVGAAQIVLLHNHPSGDASPSEADIRATRDLVKAGSLLKIPIIDHLIVGRPEFVSMKAMGYVNY